MLAISLERLAYIIVKAREFDAVVPSDADVAAGSDAPDDDEREVLLDTPDNPTEQELGDAIDGLGHVDRQEVLALMRLGRGDYDAGSWPAALRQAGETVNENLTDLPRWHALARRLSRRGSFCPWALLEDLERG